MDDRQLAQAAINRRSAGYALVGFGAPTCFAGWTLIQWVFLPRRAAPPLAPFRPDHPAFIVAAICLGIGLLLVGLGVYCLRSPVHRP